MSERGFIFLSIVHLLFHVVFLCVGLLPYLGVILFENVLVGGEVNHTLDQLQHQGRHHLDVHRLAILV